MKKILIASLLVLTACTPRELREELRLLDKELERRYEYVEAFEKKNDILRILLKESQTDSLKWVYANRLFDAYRHFNLDSCARYNAMERAYAVNASQEYQAHLHDIYEMALRGAQKEAVMRYMSVDKSDLSLSERIDYLGLGLDIFKHDSESKETLNSIRKELYCLDTLSYLGRKNLAMIYRERGDYRRSLSIFEECLDDFSDSQDVISIYYNMAGIYALTGNRIMNEICLARTAVIDIQVANKDYQSLYLLSLARLDDKDYSRAVRYINAHYSDVSPSHFYPRIMSSGVAEQRISQRYLKTMKSIRWILTFGILALTVLVAVALLLLRKNKRKNIALQNAHNALRRANDELALSNRIKESYVFRYMMLALGYMDEVEDNRKEYRRLLKDKGPDELYRVLKQVDKGYASEKQFYKIFDETFLGIFPNFVSEVNKLLQEKARFDEGSRILPTEIRILAVIRLGITSSQDIAKFLKCSLPTVYTYRAKLRNLALCKKDEFEHKISSIGL